MGSLVDSTYMGLVSVSLCLLAGACNPFAFKVIINVHVLIAILFIVICLDSFVCVYVIDFWFAVSMRILHIYIVAFVSKSWPTLVTPWTIACQALLPKRFPLARILE